jgi:predicted anti-sigma-YlaC factor YlaD
MLHWLDEHTLKNVYFAGAIPFILTAFWLTLFIYVIRAARKD